MTFNPETATHGIRNTYKRGCRCDACRDAQRAYQSRMNRDRAARLLADPTLVAHGRKTTYDNYLCRCRECTDAATAVRLGRRK